MTSPIKFDPDKHYRGNPCKRGHEGIRYKNGGKCAECTRMQAMAWYRENPELVKVRSKEEQREYRKEKRGYYNAALAACSARGSSSIPKWADLKKIRDFYVNCPAGMQVDHIVPIRGTHGGIHIVCGLHVHYNLQYLTPLQNKQKGRAKWPDMPE